MSVDGGTKVLKNLGKLQIFFGNPANKQQIKEAIRTSGKYFCRKGKGEVYLLPLGESDGKTLIIELWYTSGTFEVLQAYVEESRQIG